MKLGVMSSGIAALGWDKALAYCRELGLEAIELPCGAYAKSRLLDAEAALADPVLQQKIREDVARYGMVISALSCHGNPVHPDPAVAKVHERAQDVAVRLAPKLGVKVVCTFSGCPGGAPGDRTPNWVTCAWPPEFPQILDYQWNGVLVPYWQRKAAEARNEGVQIAFEAHPGFAVYNPETILKLRRLAGDNLGANLDPSHFFWQGIDPVEAARVLGDAGAIFHVHAKDTALDPHNMRVNGGLDTKSYGNLAERSWVFRTCGYGHGDEFWKPFVSMLRGKGYDGALSIEHEDSYMSVQEGFSKAVSYLRGVLIREPACGAWWF
ncbi:MAG TPA: sugar phosphate isomerase/epimerase [Gemmataceae bacterium]|nr:sugar phosphate isomerase/epimerase [Gemmataceae bacterium]